MSNGLSTKLRIFIVVTVALATVCFHYGLFIKPGHDTTGLFHAIHGRLCYIPIILGAIWFGVRGGLALALLIIALTIPYPRVWHIRDSAILLNEYTEMVFYVAIGLTSGILIELQRRERRRSEALSKELSRREHLSSLGQMAAGLAHEIKNPLGSIEGAAEILGDDFPPGSRKHELLRVLSKEMNRLNRVVEDFLSFARPRPLQLAEARVNELLSDVISQMEVDTRAREIQVTRNLDPAIPPSLFDEEKLHQVFLNLTLNAISAMENGGTLTITSRKKLHQGKESIIVDFEDTGKGIEKEHMDKIFDPFFTTKPSGTGLGLSISHMIIQNHGGAIEVKSSPGEGTRVRIILPVYEKGALHARQDTDHRRR